MAHVGGYCKNIAGLPHRGGVRNRIFANEERSGFSFVSLSEVAWHKAQLEKKGERVKKEPSFKAALLLRISLGNVIS